MKLSVNGDDHAQVVVNVHILHPGQMVLILAVALICIFLPIVRWEARHHEAREEYMKAARALNINEKDANYSYWQEQARK